MVHEQHRPFEEILCLDTDFWSGDHTPKSADVTLANCKNESRNNGTCRTEESVMSRREKGHVAKTYALRDKNRHRDRDRDKDKDRDKDRDRQRQTETETLKSRKGTDKTPHVRVTNEQRNTYRVTNK